MHKLEADSIQLAFNGRMILNNIYLSCQTGEIVGLIGRNGSGKSCLLQIIFGSLRGDNQSVRIDRKYLSCPYRVPNGIRYLPQDGFLPGYLTVEQVFRLFSTPPEATEGFEELRGLDRYKLQDLSGGLKKLMEVLAILHSEARFILLDEPFSFLSPVTIEKLTHRIKEMSRQKGIILTDHMYRSVLSTCDRLYLVRSGILHPVKDPQTLTDLGYISE